MGLHVTLIQGGGAGFDQAPAVQRILEAAGVRVDWDEHLAGSASLEQGGAALPPLGFRSDESADQMPTARPRRCTGRPESVLQ